MTASWRELLGLTRGRESPDLYEVLGLDRRRFDASLVERAFVERMKKLDAHRDPDAAPSVERAKEELLRARRVLKSPEARAVYEEDLAKKATTEKIPKSARPPSAAKTPKPSRTPPTKLDVARPAPAPAEPSSTKDRPTRADERSDAAVARAGPTSHLVGKTIDDKYEVVSQLGEGGMGTVYKARHKLLDKFVALKVLNPDLAFRPQVRERFLREARAAMEFVHPNAVPLRDFGHTKDGLLYMTQDYSPGRSLRAILDVSKKLERARAFALVRQCLLALGEAHRKGIVHRDVKPENILVERDTGAGAESFVARLCDFGIAKIVDTEATEGGLTGGAVIGTPHYMAPEQAAGDSVDARADLYAMGCVLYELLTGTQVFDAETAMQVIMMQVTQKPEPPSKREKGISPAIDALVLRALGKTPPSRFQTAEEFVEAIDKIASRTTSSSAEIPRPAAAPPRGKGSRVAGVAFCGACGASLPEDWRETRRGRPLGARILCLACYAPIKAGKACMGCLRALAPGVKSVPAGKTKRFCEACASKGEYLRVCAGCDVLLPFVAFERREAFAVGGKFLCRDCHKRRQK